MISMKLPKFGDESVFVRSNEAPPRVGHNDALISVKACGMNRLDLALRAGHLGPVSFPRILGSEVVGKVSDVGDAVMNYERGQRVAVSPWISCGVCDQCF